MHESELMPWTLSFMSGSFKGMKLIQKAKLSSCEVLTSKESAGIGTSSNGLWTSLDSTKEQLFVLLPCFFIALEMKPSPWASRRSWDFVSRANLVTRENFSSTWIDKCWGSLCFCLCLPFCWIYAEVLSRASLSVRLDEDPLGATDEVGLSATETAPGSSKEERVLCNNHNKVWGESVNLWRKTRAVVKDKKKLNDISCACTWSRSWKSLTRNIFASSADLKIPFTSEKGNPFNNLVTLYQY